MTLNSIFDDFEKTGRLVLKTKIIPKSAESTIVGLMTDGTMKLRIAATPEKNQANKEVARFLAEEFGTEKEKVTILSGQTDPVKLIRIEK